MKYYLVLTPISDFWRTDNEAVLLGPWCLLGAPYHLIPSPWGSAAKIKDAAEYTQHIYRDTLPVLSEKLNKLHGVSYDSRYWGILLGPWLLHFIEVLYERYARIKNAIERYPDFVTHVLPEEACSLTCHDTHDFLSVRGKVNDDWYNFKLLSLAISYLCPEKALKADFRRVPEEGTQRPYASRKKRILRGIDRMISFLLPGRVVLCDMYNLSFAEILCLELRLNVRMRELTPVKISHFEKSSFADFRRSCICDKPFTDDFFGLLFKTLLWAIPQVYIEYFKTYKEKTRIDRPVEIVGSSVGWYFNEEFKYFAAEAYLRGAKLIEFQHGGGYGMHLSVPMEFIALEQDAFYAWGEGIGNSKSRVLSSPYLERLKDSAHFKKNDFLFVGSTTHRYVSNFCSRILPDNMQKYFSDKKIFFDSLSKEALAKIIYRPCYESGWGEVKKVKTFLPNARFFLKGSLAERMKSAELIIIDHLSTTFIEALTINAPCILFWDHAVESLRPEAEKYFEVLNNAGILHRSPEEAAKKVNEIFTDPPGWWHDPKTQKAKNIFCERFAVTSGNWHKEWSSILNADKRYYF